MATGEHAPVPADGQLEPGSGTAPGAVVTASGRLSAAVEHRPEQINSPFSPVELSRLDEALTMASRETGLRFNLYLGELGPDPRNAIHELLTGLGEAASGSVVIAVSPEQRLVEIVTGEAAAERLADRGAKLGVMSMVAGFRDGDLVGGLIKGLRMLADQTDRVRR